MIRSVILKKNLEESPLKIEEQVKEEE